MPRGHSEQTQRLVDPVVEVTDADGALAGLVASSRLPILSTDAGWRGCTRDPAGDRRWWALAIGHVPAEAGPSHPSPSPALAAPSGMAAGPPRHSHAPWRACGSPGTGCGSRHYSLVRLTTQASTQPQRLHAVPEHGRLTRRRTQTPV